MIINKNKQSGFTLVELSIVIVIIGLIVAGVVGGQALIEQASLRSVISEQSAVKTAVKAFRVEYNALPGDMENARTYWAGCGASAAECNGDGSRIVDITATDVDENEAYRFWQHLNLSGLYPGAFTGVAVGTNFNGGNTGINIPQSKLNNMGISYYRNGSTREHNIMFGADVANSPSEGDIITVAQAESLDQKMDDGAPGTGVVRAGTDGTTAATNCFGTTTAGAAPVAGVYDLANADIVKCNIWVMD